MNALIVNKFLDTEIQAWRNELLKHASGGNETNLRAYSIAWVCYYFRELVFTETVQKIRAFRLEIKNEVFSLDLIWHRVAALDAALLVLSDVTSTDINQALRNLSCEGSGARSIVLRSLAIACPLINSNSYCLRESIEVNLERSFIHYDDCLYFGLLAKGDEEEKRTWYDSLKAKHTKDWNRTFFASFERNLRHHKDTYFSGVFSKAKSYFLFKILSRDYLNKQIQEELTFGQLTLEDYLERERNHPLSGGYLDFSFLKPHIN